MKPEKNKQTLFYIINVLLNKEQNPKSKNAWPFGAGDVLISKKKN